MTQADHNPSLPVSTFPKGPNGLDLSRLKKDSSQFDQDLPHFYHRPWLDWTKKGKYPGSVQKKANQIGRISMIATPIGRKNPQPLGVYPALGRSRKRNKYKTRFPQLNG